MVAKISNSIEVQEIRSLDGKQSPTFDAYTAHRRLGDQLTPTVLGPPSRSDQGNLEDAPHGKDKKLCDIPVHPPSLISTPKKPEGLETAEMGYIDIPDLHTTTIRYVGGGLGTIYETDIVRGDGGFIAMRK